MSPRMMSLVYSSLRFKHKEEFDLVGYCFGQSSSCCSCWSGNNSSDGDADWYIMYTVGLCKALNVSSGPSCPQQVKKRGFFLKHLRRILYRKRGIVTS